MKADPAAQRRLLDLQAVDTALAQLDHRRRHLPEHAALDAAALEASRQEDARVRAQVTVDDLDRDIARLEADVAQVRARRAKDEDRLAGGGLPARELTALQHEVTSLQRRQSDLEDQELELMEQRETAQGALDEVRRRLEQARAERDAAQARRDAALAAIDKDEQFQRLARGPAVADLPADLLALYDRVREACGGLAAAPIHAGRCGGCRIEFSGSERARIRAAAPDEVIRCEDCRRIMVRTPESGL
ncbi:MAG TPA: C4-type zinc ribbon domain-containing protein [Pilimelia sp.]|nr:C4-type zinc ribbon domain-containing protein [Pilimelia sp.]